MTQVQIKTIARMHEEIAALEADNAKLREALIDAVHEIKSQFVLRFDCNFDEAGEDNPTVKAARALLGGEE
jgi:phage gp36-like protein